MKHFRHLIAATLLVFLSACELPDEPVFWDNELDVYMASFGYTISTDRKVIFKNGIMLFEYIDCYRCPNIKYHAPNATYSAVVQDELAAYNHSMEMFLNDFYGKVEVQPAPVVEEVK